MFNIKNYYSLELCVETDFECLGDTSSQKRKVLSFCESELHLARALDNKNIVIVIVTKKLFSQYRKLFNKSVIVTNHPRFVFWELHNELYLDGLLKPEMSFGVGNNCFIHPSAEVSDKVFFGDGVKVGANCVIQDYTIIGDATHIEAGAVIGSQGMQNCIGDKGKLHILHAGGVKIGRNVMVMANAIIARAVYPEFTEVGDDTVISVLSSVGHASIVGKNCNIAGNVLIGGSARIGDNVWIGPSVTIKDGVTVGSAASIKLGSVVISDVLEKRAVSGNFAYDHARHLRKYIRAVKDK